MDLLSLLSLLIFTFGSFAFTAAFVFWLRGLKEPDKFGGAFLFLCACWFVLNLSVTLAELYRASLFRPLYFLTMAMSALFPPLIMHGVYAEYRACLASRFWRFGIALTYGVSVPLALVFILVGVRLVRVQMSALGPLLATLFLAASMFGVAVLPQSRKKMERALERSYRRLNFLLVVGIAVFVLLGFLYGRTRFGEYLLVLFRSTPLSFLFVSAYFKHRLAFYDVLLKQGTFFLVSLVSLTTYVALVLPALEKRAIEGTKGWIYTITLLPLLLATPWVYRRLESWLDRVWLGRRFTPVTAAKFFSTALQTATTEEELVKRGQAQLAEIFQADVHIALGSNSAAKEGLDVILEVGIESHGERAGIIQLGRRANQAPYLSEDIALLASLADTFSFVLENIRLQVRKQELTLQAVRSDLKALRAQINPHFLFNALNAVAGLIHKDPVRAEETVEQLSEVFRYTLTRSEKEWVRLQEELDFVRSYLDVEQVRFGDRLQVRIEIEPGVEKAAIPAMMVQTLVENAIKHGVASVRGVGVVEVQARHTGSQLRIQVSDNGPGFRDTPSAESPTQGASPGHGLKNIRERLQGYFGDAAILRAEHDESLGRTVVSVEMPMFTTPLAEGVTIR